MIGRPSSRVWPTVVGGLVGAMLAWAPSHAQMQLPGAFNGAPSNEAGAAPKAHSGGGSSAVDSSVPAKPVIIPAPGEDALADKTLYLDGTKGTMTFAAEAPRAGRSDAGKTGADLHIIKLQFAGDKISKPGTACSVDVPAPPVATAAGRPNGARRYDLAIASCPLVFDILDGAILVSPTAGAAPACAFAADDCKADPTGLWGPPASAMTPKQDKDLERERVRLETTMRADFRALIKRAKSDKAAVKAIARDQAAFSSDRETTCRDYKDESVHGFCSTRITQARVLALIARFGEGADDAGAEHRHAAHQHARARTRPATDAPPPSGSEVPSDATQPR